jgi:hypothetical protein
MYPSQTSLIPATVSLIRFFFNHGYSAFSLNYPYWYMGTTPFRYLIGPVMPVFYSLANIFAPKAQIFTISIYLVIVGIVLSGVGWTWLVFEIFKKIELKKAKIFYFVIFLVYLIFPWKYLTGLAMDETANFIAKSLSPFALVAVWSYLQGKSAKALIISSLASCVLILTHSNVIATLLIGSLALGLTASWKEGRLKRADTRIKRAVTPLAIGFLVSFLWYGPGFWLRILSNPSIGGKSGVGAILGIVDFLKNLIPVGLAIVVVYFKSKFKDRFQVFLWSWLGVFVMFTLFRFIGNPAFYMDWSSWFYEIEIGLWLLSVSFICGKKYIFSALTFTAFAVITLIFYNILGRPQLISKRFPPIVNSAIYLSGAASGKTVFTSGSSVFWLNAVSNTPQVRGGRDEVSADPSWFKAAYNFREGEDPLSIKNDLQKLNVEYVLVNTTVSSDYYKDFKNIDLWSRLGTVVFSGNGDIIYKVGK